MSYRSVVALAFVALVGSCETACACSQPQPASATLTGTVEGKDGSPVANATVGVVSSSSANCPGPASVFAHGPTTVTGEYSLILFTGVFGPAVVCFDVFATLSAASPDTTWSRDHSVTADLDPPTIRIDLTFAP